VKLDLHIHSTYSRDANGTPKELVKQAIARGLDGIAITDHNSVSGGLEAKKIAPPSFIIIPGTEISTAEGHLLALGVTSDIPRGLPLRDSIQATEDLGGVAIVAHPYRLLSSARIGASDRVDGLGIETLNARCSAWANRRAELLATAMDLGRTGGSDAHTVAEVGNAVTLFDRTSYDVDDLLVDIALGKTKPSGQSATYPTMAIHLWSKCIVWLQHKGKRV